MYSNLVNINYYRVVKTFAVMVVQSNIDSRVPYTDTLELPCPKLTFE